MKVRHLYLSIILLLVKNIVFAQNAYIQTDIIKVAGVTTDGQINALSVSGKQTTYTYLNGLGTSAQKVAYQEATNSQDIVQVYQYDQFGQKSVSYLPYVDDNTANTNGSYRTTALTDQQNYYINNNTPGNLNKVANDPLPFSQELFENSPLHRLLAIGSTGLSFQPDVQDNSQHYTIINYRNNTQADNVMISPITSNTSFYPANALSVTDAKDADGVETLIFKNSAGQTFLKRQISGQTLEKYYDTYYVYNVDGSIAYIIPPKASNLIATGANTNIAIAPLCNLIYAYTYDQLGRVATRKVPNAGIMNIVYDPMNRPILMQDGNKAATNVNQWYYIKYDGENRAISQGIYTDAVNIGQANMQTYVNNNYGPNFYEIRSPSASTEYYSNQVFPINGNPLAFAYYDTYDILPNGLPLYTTQGLVDANGNSIETAATSFTHGMLTMIATHTVTSGTTNMWLNKVFFYDKHRNLIQVQSNNQLNYQQGVLTDTRTVAPDFMGKPLQTKVIKVTGSGTANTNTVLTAYSYDSHNERIQSITQTYNSQTPVTTATYSYNEIGQLVTKQLGFVVSGSIPATQNLSTVFSGINTVAASSSITLSPGFSVPSGSTFTAEITANNYLQTLDYRYNIRGQLLTINNSTLANDGITNSDNTDLFGMTYLYDGTDPNLAHDLPSYTGRISAVKWSYKYNNGASTSPSNERSYVYAYDKLGQLNSALYAERASGSLPTVPFNANMDGFDETGITYDDDGNIKTLQRNASTTNGTGGTPLDNLTYTYDPNNPDRLDQVADQVPTTPTSTYGFNNIGNPQQQLHYQYDADGNLMQDPYKNISIAYNPINKIDVITAPGISNSTINYTYDASGTVLKKQVYQNGVLQTASATDYIDEFVYINGALSYFAMPEGRVVSSGGTFKPEYIIADQQGNARFSFQDNGSGSPLIIQENSYYGFGEVMPGSLVITQQPLPTANNNIYNGGSEWQNVFGNLPDYYQAGSRDYDPELGRFISVDPMAEMTESLTNYHYASNNPITHNDPTGNCDPGDEGCDITPFITQTDSNGVDIDTGGGGGGNPGTNYSGDNVPATSTSEGGVYNSGNQLGNSAIDQGSIFSISPSPGNGFGSITPIGAINDDPIPNLPPPDNGLSQIQTTMSNQLIPDFNGVMSQAPTTIAPDASQGGGGVVDWVENHFYWSAGISVTQGAIGGDLSKFEGLEIYNNKHSIWSISADSEHDVHTQGNDGKSLYGGKGVIPADLPIGIEIAKDVNNNTWNGSLGVGMFGYEREGNENFVGFDPSKAIGLYFIGLEINLKVGFKW